MNTVPPSGDPVVDSVCQKLADNANGDPVVQRLIEKLVSRSQAGQIKYGTTLAAANLSTEELLNHAQQEALDLANYLQALISKHPPVMTLDYMQDEALAVASILEGMLLQLSDTKH